jgi:hypothetical protein
MKIKIGESILERDGECFIVTRNSKQSYFGKLKHALAEVVSDQPGVEGDVKSLIEAFDNTVLKLEKLMETESHLIKESVQEPVETDFIRLRTLYRTNAFDKIKSETPTVYGNLCQKDVEKLEAIGVSVKSGRGRKRIDSVL